MFLRIACLIMVVITASLFLACVVAAFKHSTPKDTREWKVVGINDAHIMDHKLTIIEYCEATHEWRQFEINISR